MALSQESVISFQNQLTSIMEVLVKNAVFEITKLFESRMVEIQSVCVARREMKNASEFKAQQQLKTPEDEHEYHMNSQSTKKEFEARDEHVCTGTIDVFGRLVANSNDNITNTSTTLPGKQDNGNPLDQEFEQRWSSDLWQDGATLISGAGRTETQPVQVKQEVGQVKLHLHMTSKERTRRYRERINADPSRREEILRGRRRKYHERKASGEMKTCSIKLLTKERSKQLREQWRASKERCRKREQDLKAVLNLTSESPENEIQTLNLYSSW